MNNLFNTANYPTNEPSILALGDRWAWKRTDLSDYGTGYTLTYDLSKLSSIVSKIAVTASHDGADYVVEVASATTATYTAGDYAWTAYITRDSDSERVPVGNGRITIKDNLATSTADQRTHAEKVLDAIEAVIEARATVDQESYTINGRSLNRTPRVELIKMYDKYKAMVARERRDNNAKQGIADKSNKIVMRFS